MSDYTRVDAIKVGWQVGRNHCVDDLVRSGRVIRNEDVRRLIDKGGGKVNGDESSGSSQDGDDCAFKRACLCSDECSEAPDATPCD